MVDALWVAVQDALRARLSVKDFDTWIRPLRPLAWGAGCLTVEVPSVFARDWLSRHLVAEIDQALVAAAREEAHVRLTVNRDLGRGTSARRQPKRQPARRPSLPAGLQRYSFDGFVIGPSNEVAFRACLSVVEAPGSRFNPLVLHGGVGLGKTHLLSATANALLDDGRTTVRLVPAESFVNELVHAVRRDGMARFRDRYRGVGVLIIDDVQFLAGKQRSQEEFIHTFNALRDLGKQIVLASDRPPSELREMSTPLRSRLASGLLAGIEPPRGSMRVALVARKLAERGLETGLGVEELLAELDWTNVRELEGQILRLEAFGNAAPLDRAAVARLLGGTARRGSKPISIDDVVGVVCQELGVTHRDLQSPRRTARLSTARQVAMRLCRTLTDDSLQTIGRAFGGRDHSTVAHALDRMARRLDSDEELRGTVQRLEARLAR